MHETAAMNGVRVDERRNPQAATDSILAGANLTGTAASDVLGVLATGAGTGASLEGALFGSVAGQLSTQGIYTAAPERKRRALGRREEQRGGRALTFAREQYAENVGQGMRIRDDGSFQDGTDDRSTAMEVMESVLLGSTVGQCAGTPPGPPRRTRPA